jgi:hypothetical protein
LSLKTQGLLQAEQLTLLFRAQLTTQVSPLFQLYRYFYCSKINLIYLLGSKNLVFL